LINLSEDPAERARRYITSLESALGQLIPVKSESIVPAESIGKVFSDTIQRYLRDARYYLENGKPTTSLASIAYAEGLLDALTFLGLTKRRTTE
jgi:hypothetical protein